jgi:hypothetical protein
MESIGKRKNGRPSKAEQLEIQKKLWPYFSRGISAFTTAKETGINIKTVNKYFAIWFDQSKNSQDHDFIEKCKIENQRAFISYENELSRLYKMRDDLMKDFQESGKDLQSRKWYYKLDMEISKMIIHLTSLKTALVNSPTADVTLDILQKEQRQTILEGMA